MTLPKHLRDKIGYQSSNEHYQNAFLKGAEALWKILSEVSEKEEDQIILYTCDKCPSNILNPDQREGIVARIQDGARFGLTLGRVKAESEELSKEKPFRFQFHTPTANGKNFRIVMELLKRVIDEGKLKIEVVEVPYDKITELETKLQKCVEALEFYGSKLRWRFSQTMFDNEIVEDTIDRDDVDENYIGGKRARSVLAELKDEGEK